MTPKFLIGVVCGITAILLTGLLIPHSGNSGGGTNVESSSGLGAMSQSIDVDHPPATISVAKGATITLVRFGTSKQNTTVTAYASDGKGELLMKLSGGPNGTVATFRALRDGRGVIQIRNDKAGPGGALTHTINVTVR